MISLNLESLLNSSLLYFGLKSSASEAKLAANIRKKTCLFLCLLSLIPAVGSANESFTVNFGEDVEAKTIGDLRPKVLALKKKPIPDVSIEYVMKRYRKLFENAKSPDVKIEALDRLNSLSASFGITEKDLTVDPYVQAEVILDTYQRIVDSGGSYQRMDELLYQTAKATAFTGDILESIKRLELLVGLYPKSPLVEEALFRLAENYFDLAEFNRAKDYYQRLIDRTQAPRLKAFSQYKLAWANYRLERESESLTLLAGLFDAYPGVYNALMTTDLNDIPLKPSAFRGFDLQPETGLLADGVRLLAILNTKGDRIANIKASAASLGGSSRELLVLRSLVDQLSAKKRHFDAARLIEGYTEDKGLQSEPGRARGRELFSYSLRAIDLYAEGGHTIESWKAKSNLVERFGIRSDFWKSASSQVQEGIREDLIVVTGELAHLNFVRMQEATVVDQRKVRDAKQAASYYLQLAALTPNTVQSYESMYLAAQALEIAGQTNKAGELYVAAGYSPLQHPYQDKAAYSAFYLASSENGGAGDGAAQQAQWSDRQFDLAKRYLDQFPEHEAAASTALAVSKGYVNAGRNAEALAIHESFGVFTKATPAQVLTNSIALAAMYYNAAQNYDAFKKAERQYLSALELAQKAVGGNASVVSNVDAATEQSTFTRIKDGVVNSRFNLAEQAATPDLRIQHYVSIFEEYPEHQLAVDSAFNAASVAVQNSMWQKGAAMHQVFLEAFPSHELVAVSRQQLIVALEALGRTQEAADTLMVQADRLLGVDDTLSANSAYTAAGYYADNEFPVLAAQSYQWLLSSHPERTRLGVEALAYLAAVADVRGETKLAAAERLVSYVEEHELDDARSATLAAENALQIASAQRDKFNKLKITQPFKASLKQKTAALDLCTRAYKRVVKFGVSEYTNAARFEMADIYQGLAHAIMDSERPSGLSPLEQEQYAILLEEQAIPIEEEAIALHEQNVKARGTGQADEWIVASYNALARLNPSLYERPIIGPTHAPVSY